MNLYLGADHGGFELKEALKLALTQASPLPAQVEDLGAFTHDPTDDYPQFGFAVAEKVSDAAVAAEDQPTSWGILICRSGGGIAIAANRHPGVRAVVCRTLSDVDHARRHNNANVLVLEGDHIGPDAAFQLTQNFLATPFDGGRHTRRVQELQ